MPAGADGELGFDLGGMQRVILRDQEGLKGGTIHKQSHCWELDVQHVVMPFLITHLGGERLDQGLGLTTDCISAKEFKRT